MDRRRYLRRAAAALAAGLAGCGASPDDGTDAEPTATSTPTAEPTPTDTPTPTDSPTPSPTATPTELPPVAAEVTVGPGGALRFDPETVSVAVGETVRWLWDSGGHNVKPSSIPSGSDWSGTTGGNTETFGAGHVYEHTFEVAGRYDYICFPHRSAGMTATVTVE